jgi:hypothetical protein
MDIMHAELGRLNPSGQVETKPAQAQPTESSSSIPLERLLHVVPSSAVTMSERTHVKRLIVSVDSEEVGEHGTLGM